MKIKIYAIVLFVLILAFGGYLLFFPKSDLPPAYPSSQTMSNKDMSLKLGEIGVFNKISIRPVSIEEDSRCPIDVQCIQTGTVRLKIAVISNSNTNESIIKLGEEFTTEGVRITLEEVNPITNSKIQILKGDYVFKINVKSIDAPVVTNPSGQCYVGGCSGQICSDQPNMASTCEYREEYGCYKKAVCERQKTGQCGWTPSTELNICLGNK